MSRDNHVSEALRLKGLPILFCSFVLLGINFKLIKYKNLQT